MNWLARARREFREIAQRSAAKRAERSPTALLAAPNYQGSRNSSPSNGSIDSAQSAPIVDFDTLSFDYQERAAILEYEGGVEPFRCGARGFEVGFPSRTDALRIKIMARKKQDYIKGRYSQWELPHDR